jgi:DNA-binding SARP family transcriptional activator
MSNDPSTAVVHGEDVLSWTETGGRRWAVADDSAPIEFATRPLQIFTFGRFSVVKDGVPLGRSRKTPKKPVALLKVLLAFGGRDVSGRQLTDALWPDEEGDAAHNVLAVNLHRLRKLLGEHDVVVLHDGRVSLDPRRCWVDTWAFEGLLGTATEVSSDAHPILLEAALSIYGGAFLVCDGDEPWSLSMRERLHGKFIRHSADLGRLREESGQWDKAIACYERGLEADQLAEEFYQGLMRCYGHLGRRAEGVSVYRRLRRTLSVMLGITASPASELLFRELLS